MTVTVAAPQEEMIRRALDRARREGRPLSRQEVERRIALQMPMEEKRRRATYVIENDGTLEQLRERARTIWEKLRERACCTPSASAAPED
ncbi:MAG: hypothetical protein KatS3mg115_0392 [Candidatus Poribacteria bacterium]|nr:MAG: hypothetical protein KatS3mg115_0392 [Candidatus Poribacteria bacterium]